MKGLWHRILIAALGWAIVGPAVAHEMGTSALSIREFGAGQAVLIFKRSQSADGRLPPIDFQFEPACELHDVRNEWEGDNEVVQHALLNCSTALQHHRLKASGFTRLSPDLIVQVQTADQPLIQGVLTPQRPDMSLAPGEAPDLSLQSYFITGVEHIVFGLDHVLFVIGLFILWWRSGEAVRRLVALFTLFTVGHSLTLALVAMDVLVVPTRAIEAWIALSVLWLAFQLAMNRHHTTSAPVVLLFGLLHGSGFALSMQDKGFPADQLLPTLLAFNVGIEAGQILIVGALGLGFLALRRVSAMGLPPLRDWAEHALVMLTGGFALFWTVERMMVYV
ncbi:MAG: HupE/UreJ family protein [Limnobacter sp.]|uniref:HupE/UreJ family protein n=1 Tax=Limnobacter sp. TaxID=2003368 RepID=UPI00391DC113